MPPQSEDNSSKSLPPPWDRIFSLGTRLFVWALLAGTIYLLRPFFLLIFLTFVFAYIQAHGVDGLRDRIKNRTVRVVLVSLVFLGTIFATGYSTFPQIEKEATNFIHNAPEYIKQADRAVERALRENPSLARALGRDDLVPPEPDPNGEEGQQPAPTPTPPPGHTPKPMVGNLIGQLIGLGTGEDTPKDPNKTMTENLKKATDAFSQVVGVASSFLLSLLFSFLIVLDLPTLKRGIAGLQHTKVGFIYDEVADNIHEFGKVLGRALEAQFFIALVNTLLTGIGIYFMGLENLVFLCTIVFLASFIPVAGVFISSAPICLMALQVSGFGLMFLGIGLILAIHAIEAYILNPKIFGHHLRMNPVLVLIVLTISGKLFGIWGLVLGLPIVNYVFRHAIRREQPSDVTPIDSAAA